MSDYPQKIKSEVGSVEEKQRCYTGYSCALDTKYGEIIITTDSVKMLEIMAIDLMPYEFKFNKEQVQKVAIFDEHKVTKHI